MPSPIPSLSLFAPAGCEWFVNSMGEGMEDYTFWEGDGFFIEVGRELHYSKDDVGKISEILTPEGMEGELYG